MNAQARVALIWAMSENRVIGRAGGLPWRLPDEMAHFKRTTMGNPIVMGRRTWTGRALPGRTSIVVSRAGLAEVPEGVHVVATLAEGIALARASTAGEEVFVTGGAEIYAQALPIADRLYMTVVHAVLEGDVYFPEFALDEFELLEEQTHEADARHAYAFTIQVLQRRAAARS